MNPESVLHDPPVMIDFNATAYNNEHLFLRYIDTYLPLALQGPPSPFTFDCTELNKTMAMLAK